MVVMQAAFNAGASCCREGRRRTYERRSQIVSMMDGV